MAVATEVLASSSTTTAAAAATTTTATCEMRLPGQLEKAIEEAECEEEDIDDEEDIGGDEEDISDEDFMGNEEDTSEDEEDVGRSASEQLEASETGGFVSPCVALRVGRSGPSPGDANSQDTSRTAVWPTDGELWLGAVLDDLEVGIAVSISEADDNGML